MNNCKKVCSLSKILMNMRHSLRFHQENIQHSLMGTYTAIKLQFLCLKTLQISVEYKELQINNNYIYQLDIIQIVHQFFNIKIRMKM